MLPQFGEQRMNTTTSIQHQVNSQFSQGQSARFQANLPSNKDSNQFQIKAMVWIHMDGQSGSQYQTNPILRGERRTETRTTSAVCRAPRAKSKTPRVRGQEPDADKPTCGQIEIDPAGQFSRVESCFDTKTNPIANGLVPNWINSVKGQDNIQKISVAPRLRKQKCQIWTNRHKFQWRRPSSVHNLRMDKLHGPQLLRRKHLKSFGQFPDFVFQRIRSDTFIVLNSNSSDPSSVDTRHSGHNPSSFTSITNLHGQLPKQTSAPEDQGQGTRRTKVLLPAGSLSPPRDFRYRK